MDTTAAPSPTPPNRTLRGPRPGTDLGQWKVSGHAPLNPNEEFKAVENPLNVRQRILDVYATQGIASIPSDDLTGRFRWWGLYTQRKQGIPGNATSKLEADELSDDYFMLRVRTDGGQVTTQQLRALASISTDFARGTADISDRQNIQYHWIAIEDVPEIWRRLDEVGLDSIEACGDTPRVILGGPVAGVAADEIIDPTPVIDAIKERYIGSEEFANLPRKFKSAITGSPSLDIVHEINDISLVGVVHPELGPGYDLWVGGGLSTAPRLAERLGVFVTQEQAPEVWAGVVSVFRDYGYRKMRTKARLKFLLNEWGVERFRQVLEQEYLGYALPDGPPPAPASGSADHVGVHPQRDGRVWVGFAPLVGRVGGPALHAVADAAEAVGSQRVRFTPHQKLLVLDVPTDRADELIAALAPHGLDATPGAFRRATMACTGIEFCKLAFVETKALAADVAGELDRRLAQVDLGRPISLHVNGCPNSCARIQVADIGLKGQLVGDGEYSFQVHLGGGVASQDRETAGLGRTVRGLKVAADDLPDYVERVVGRYVDAREPGQPFADWVAGADEEALR